MAHFYFMIKGLVIVVYLRSILYLSILSSERESLIIFGYTYIRLRGVFDIIDESYIVYAVIITLDANFFYKGYRSVLFQRFKLV